MDGAPVVALRFDAAAVADDLARWCNGQVVLTESVDGALMTTIYVPTSKGPLPALPGDWIVMAPDGTFKPMTSAAFSARYEPEADGL